MLLLKCRDKDARLREAAYEMLAHMPAGPLHAVFKAEDWRPALYFGLGLSGMMRGGIADGLHNAQAVLS